MSEQPEDDPEVTVALEPDTLPEQPLTAERASALLWKEIGLPVRPSSATRKANMGKTAEVVVNVADTELVRSLIDDVAAAARKFAHLGDDDLAVLPDAVQSGIRALRQACGRASGTIPPARTADGQPVHWGCIGIEWPAPSTTAPIGGRAYARPMVAWKIAIWDATDGTPIYTARQVVLRAGVDNWVTADLTMFADEDGKPVLDGKPHVRDGEIIEGTFSFLVAEMRVRQPQITEPAPARDEITEAT